MQKETNKIRPINYLTELLSFSQERTRAVVNPFQPLKEKTTSEEIIVDIHDYNATDLDRRTLSNINECIKYHTTANITWVNMDGLNKSAVEQLCNGFDIHLLIQEDILSYGQRPKFDELDNLIYVLMNMLYFNESTATIEAEQISIVLTKNTVISIQEDKDRDVFDSVREKLKVKYSKLRQSTTDYLFYTLIDMIVDSYFTVLEKLGEQIAIVEEMLMKKPSRKSFNEIAQLRKEIILLKRNTAPVRDIISSILRSDSDLLEERTTKYFKDVYDHIIQVNDLTENYRDMIMGLQDMYMNNLNLRSNEVMKTLAIVTTVMAPATVIGGIFGMNFDIIPYQHQEWGFYGTVSAMILIPLFMIWWFRKRGWFEKDIPETEPHE